MFISSLDSETPFVLWEAEGTKEEFDGDLGCTEQVSAPILSEGIS